MFGYVIPDKPNLFIKDFYAFRAYYCGLCKATGKRAGTVLRLATNYDATILNILVHNLVNKSVELKDQRCILHPFTKKTMIVFDDVTANVADINLLLLYYKVCDNVIDKDGVFKNKTARSFMRRAYKKASRRHPEADTIIKSRYEDLRKNEQEDCTSIDIVSDPFASMLQDLGVYLTGKSSYEVKTVFYCLGKWIYLIDALDDLDEDYKKQRYNPWISAFKDFETAEKFIEKNSVTINEIINNVINLIIENYNKLDMPIQEGVLTNTFYYGLRAQTDRVLRRDKKCQKTRL